MEKGKLFLIPTPLGDTDPSAVIPEGTLEIIRQLEVFVVEELRTARRFLKKAGYTKPFDEVTFLLLNEHTLIEDFSSLIKPALEGRNTGLLSEAGMPCIADPGSDLAMIAHQSGVRVIPLTGPSSIFLALAASGFNGQNFSFSGYLPVEREKRNKRLKELERMASEKDQTQIFIETPYRNGQMFQSLTEVCRDETLLCLAADLTAPGEWVSVKTIREWRKEKPDLNKRPCVFLLYK
ncbi:MAG: SAM-dependent methyltransferase [bacterium]